MASVVVITVVAPADYRKDSWTTAASLRAKTCSGTRGGGRIETVTLQLKLRTFLHGFPSCFLPHISERLCFWPALNYSLSTGLFLFVFNILIFSWIIYVALLWLAVRFSGGKNKYSWHLNFTSNTTKSSFSSFFTL